MRLLDQLTLAAIFFGPITAVLISVWITIRYQNRKERRDAKINLYRTLIVHRKSQMPPFELVNALSLIDVEFADNPKVVARWHGYYDVICRKEPDRTAVSSGYFDLLQEIAKSLGYPEPSAMDIDKFYTPQGHIDMWDLNLRTQVEWLRVLENTAKLLVDKRDDEKSASSEPSSPN
jgi:hypothetical protein